MPEGALPRGQWRVSRNPDLNDTGSPLSKCHSVAETIPFLAGDGNRAAARRPAPAPRVSLHAPEGRPPSGGAGDYSNVSRPLSG